MQDNEINVSFKYLLEHDLPVKVKDGKRTFMYNGIKVCIVRADIKNKCYICVKEEV